MPPMPNGPRRRTVEQRRKHLDAHLVPFELALLHRADDMEARAITRRVDEMPWGQLAAEFRALAEELHFW